MITLIVIFLLLFPLKVLSTDYPLAFKHGDECGRYIYSCEIKCGAPGICDYRKGSAKAFCSKCAREGEWCMYTGCCDLLNFYCDGRTCRRKVSFKKAEPICLAENQRCERKRTECILFYRYSDNCCYPMHCNGTRANDRACVGKSKKNQQCTTTTCKDGLFCDQWGNCLDCYQEGEECSKYKDKCCHGQCVSRFPNEAPTCQSCEVVASKCDSNLNKICCEGLYCIHQLNGEKRCEECSLTSEPCKSIYDCCYDNDKCENGICIKKEPDINHENLCSSESQICKTVNGYKLKCCNNANCSEKGVCLCIKAGQVCNNTNGACCGDNKCLKTVNPGISRCRKCIEMSKSCHLSSYDVCCDGAYCIPSLYNSASCLKCSLTSQVCDVNSSCCYDSDECRDGVCLKKTSNALCSYGLQICQSADGFSNECCDGSECNKIGVCTCGFDNSPCDQDRNCCQQYGYYCSDRMRCELKND